MEKMLLIMRFFIFQKPGCKRTMLVFCRKWLTTHIMPINCEMTVAVAAPRIPQSKWKMKIGARIMLHTTVTIEVSIAFLGYPVARMMLFNPIIVYVTGVPNRIICIKFRAYGSVSLLAPKKRRISSRKIKEMPPNRNALTRHSIRVWFSTSVAPSVSFCPRRMDDMVEPPAETTVQKATTRFISGKVMASPAIPMAPTP